MKHLKRPCDECPWRTDAEPGRFAPERWAALASSSANARGHGPEVCGVLFACHKSPEGGERACAGWLAIEGAQHPQVRLAVVFKDLPVSALSPGEGWPALHGSFIETMTHDMQEDR